MPNTHLQRDIDISVNPQADPARGAETPSPGLRANVAADLKAIFAPLPRPAAAAAAQGAAKAGKASALAPTGSVQRRRRYILALIFIALLGCTVILLGLVRRVLPSAIVPQPAAAFAPARSGGARVARLATNNGSLAGSPAVRAATEPVPTPSSTTMPAAAPAPVRLARRPDPATPPQKSANARNAGQTEADAPPRRSETVTAAAPAPQSVRPCEQGASEAWCLRDAILDADRTLRSAYADAVSAGVERSVLVGIRADWTRLRRRALKDPQTLLRGYAALTEALRQQTREARS